MYAIKLESKYTGDHVWLGFQFKTFREASEYADAEVCGRCNRVSIIEVGDHMVWRDKRRGFQPEGGDDARHE